MKVRSDLLFSDQPKLRLPKISADSSHETMLYRIEPKNADQNPDTSKPFSSDAHNQKHSAFTTSMKSPSVRIVTGSVSRISTGRNTALMRPSTTATISAVPKLRMWIDGTMYVMIS